MPGQLSQGLNKKVKNSVMRRVWARVGSCQRRTCCVSSSCRSTCTHIIDTYFCTQKHKETDKNVPLNTFHASDFHRFEMCCINVRCFTAGDLFSDALCLPYFQLFFLNWLVVTSCPSFQNNQILLSYAPWYNFWCQIAQGGEAKESSYHWTRRWTLPHTWAYNNYWRRLDSLCSAILLGLHF